MKPRTSNLIGVVHLLNLHRLRYQWNPICQTIINAMTMATTIPSHPRIIGIIPRLPRSMSPSLAL